MIIEKLVKYLLMFFSLFLTSFKNFLRSFNEDILRLVFPFVAFVAFARY